MMMLMGCPLVPLAQDYYHRPFYRTVMVDIQLAKSEENVEQWLQTQPPLNRQDFQVFEIASIPKILKYYDINVQIDNLTVPSYNVAGETTFRVPFKAGGPQGLKAVFFKVRTNWINRQYPSLPYQLTLKDLLKYEFEIERAFVFWDGHQSRLTVNPPQIHLINYTDYITNHDEQAKKNAINEYLAQHHINPHRQPMQIGSFNGAETTGMTLPLPANATYEGKKIEAVYFDKGSRVLPTNQNYALTDLLKLANGAQNIYLFYSERRIKTFTHKINNINDIPYIMQNKYGIYGIIMPYPNTPSYNNADSRTLYYYFLQPNSDLLGVYFQTYPKKTFPYGNNNHRLAELLTYTDAIEKAYIFKKSSEYDKIQTKIREQRATRIASEQAERERIERETVEKAERKRVERIEQEQIERETTARIIRENFEKIERERVEREREDEIEIQRFAKEKAELAEKIRTQAKYEANERTYKIECEQIRNEAIKSQYYAELQAWKNQCYFQAGKTYTGYKIREKLGRSDRKLYCLNDNDIINNNSYIQNSKINACQESINQYTLFYKYITGYIEDAWYFTKYQNENIKYFREFNLSNKNLLSLGVSIDYSNIKFNTYCDTTPPPMKPSIVFQMEKLYIVNQKN